MNNPEREQAIERLLRQSPDDRASSVSGVCLDVETLAAWSDDALSAEERAGAESHAADCGRCQALLAAMAKTAPAPVENPAWWWRPAFAWAIPLTAVAAALVIWVAVPKVDQHPAIVSVAETRTSNPANPPLQPPVRDEDQSGVELQTVPQKIVPSAKKELQGQSAISGSRHEPVSGGERDADRGRFGVGSGSEPRRVDPGSVSETGQISTRSGSDVAKTDVVEGKLDALRQKPTLADAAANAAPPSAPAAPSPPAAPEPAAAGPMAKAMSVTAPAVVEIVSSNPGSRWRIVGGVTVQRSMDGGSTWQDQQTRTSGPLTAGSSPSPSVCWLVGPAGTVIVTADGRSWRRVAFPEAVDLLAIRASDAQSATVTMVDGRSFSTTDGGQTWSR